jgi:hypothetical protein
LGETDDGIWDHSLSLSSSLLCLSLSSSLFFSARDWTQVLTMLSMSSKPAFWCYFKVKYMSQHVNFISSLF